MTGELDRSGSLPGVTGQELLRESLVSVTEEKKWGRGMLVRARGPSKGEGVSLGSLAIRIALPFPLLFCIGNSRGRERRGFLSRSGVIHKAGWGWWGEWSVGGKRCTPPALTLSRCTLPGGRGELSRLTCNRVQEPPLA